MKSLPAEQAAFKLKTVRAEMASACGGVGHDAPTIIAVSKTIDREGIVPFLDAGHRVFGENRVQEAQGKWPSLRSDYEGVSLHLIGPLQSNKAEAAVGLFDVIQTLDREKLAVLFADLAQKRGCSPRFFVQVNTGREYQKAGVLPEDAEHFVSSCRTHYHLPVEGLMCIPPVDENPVPHFQSLRQLGHACGVSALSMGMSGDYVQAAAEGATHVRLGTALFGARGQAF